MSLILDALNRADRERSEQQLSPSLHAAPSAPGDARSQLWRPLVVIAAVAALAVIAIYFWLPAQRAPAVDSGAASTVLPAPPASTPAPANEPVIPIDSEPPAVAPVADEPMPPPARTRTAATTAAVDDAPVAKDRDSSSRSAIAELYTRPAPAAAPPSALPPPAPKPPPAPQATSPARPTQAMILQSIPLLASMPANFQKQVPSIEYSIHVYNQEDGSGAVKLNGNMLRVGAELTPGLRVIAILPDSTVFDFNGTQFRLSALNSWMNFQ